MSTNFVLKPMSTVAVSAGSNAFYTFSASASSGTLVGGVAIGADGTNTATVTLQETGPAGAFIMTVSTKLPTFIPGPIQARTNVIFLNVIGTGANAFVYERINAGAGAPNF